MMSLLNDYEYLGNISAAATPYSRDLRYEVSANNFENGLEEFRESLGSKGALCWSPFLIVHKGYGVYFDTFRDDDKLFVRWNVSNTNISGSTLFIDSKHEELVEKVKTLYNEVVEQLDTYVKVKI